MSRRGINAQRNSVPTRQAQDPVGCLLQIRRFLDAGIPVVRPIELLDAAISPESGQPT
jgi:hypothetical protein